MTDCGASSEPGSCSFETVVSSFASCGIVSHAPQAGLVQTYTARTRWTGDRSAIHRLLLASLRAARARGYLCDVVLRLLIYIGGVGAARLGRRGVDVLWVRRRWGESSAVAKSDSVNAMQKYAAHLFGDSPPRDCESGAGIGLVSLGLSSREAMCAA